MATAKDIVNKAASFIGVKEDPPDTNNVIFNTDYYGRHVYGSDYPWCCAFVWDIFRMCGASDLFYYGKKTAYCPEVMKWGIHELLIVDNDEGRPGDLILFDWNHDDVPDHIAIIEKYNWVNEVYTTIEGNTAIGNDSNGGEVMRRIRNVSDVCCIIRPEYQEDEMSYSNFEKDMKQWQEEQAEKGVPQDKDSWQYKAWEFVTMAGISDGFRPYSPVTRIELWGMLRIFYQLIVKTFGGKK